MSLIKSKKRVADHGEVFTPPWMVEAMLNLVKAETERIDSRFLEPACGSGNFLVPVLQRKLAAVELKFGKSDFEKRHYALLALMCIYGIELLERQHRRCRAVCSIFSSAISNLNESDDLYRAGFYVLSQNLVHGDALTMCARSRESHHVCRVGVPRQGQVPAARLPLPGSCCRIGFQRGGVGFSLIWGKHEIFTPIKNLPANDGG